MIDLLKNWGLSGGVLAVSWLADLQVILSLILIFLSIRFKHA